MAIAAVSHPHSCTMSRGDWSSHESVFFHLDVNVFFCVLWKTPGLSFGTWFGSQSSWPCVDACGNYFVGAMLAENVVSQPDALTLIGLQITNKGVCFPQKMVVTIINQYEPVFTIIKYHGQ